MSAVEGETLSQKLHRLERRLAGTSAPPPSVTEELRAIESPILDEVVRLAKSSGPDQRAATHVLIFKWDPFFKAIVSDIRHVRDVSGYSPTSSRQRLRAFARQFRGSDLLQHELDRAELKNQATVTFLDLLHWYDPDKWKSFPSFIEHYLPLRMENWLQRELFRKEGGALKLKRVESVPDLEWAPADLPDFDVPSALDQVMAFLESESVRRYLLAALSGIVRSQGFALDPVLIPRQTTLLTAAGDLHEPSRYYRPPRRRRFPLYIPRNDHLYELLHSPEIAKVCTDEAKASPDRAWVVLAALATAKSLRETDLARRLQVTQQRVSHLFQTGVRRLLRRYLVAYEEYSRGSLEELRRQRL